MITAKNRVSQSFPLLLGSTINSTVQGYAAATLLVAVATLVFLPFSRRMDISHDVDLLFLPIVVICAHRFGVRPALLAAGMSVLCWDFFFIKPIYSLHIGSLHDVLLLLVFVLVSLFTANLADRARNTTRTAAILDERNRMARDIHDTLAQGLTGIVIQLQVAERVHGADLSDEGSAIRQAKMLAEQCLEEARRSVKALRPRPLEQFGLSQALRTILVEMTQGLPVETEMAVNGKVCNLPDVLETNLLRIGQEALTNALRHANARRIEMLLTYAVGTVSLRIKDDGKGFDVNRPASETEEEAFGLAGMRERAAQMSGILTIRSQPEFGTLLEVSVPIDRREEAR